MSENILHTKCIDGISPCPETCFKIYLYNGGNKKVVVLQQKLLRAVKIYWDTCFCLVLIVWVKSSQLLFFLIIP